MKKSFITSGPGCEDDQLLASLVMSKHFYLFVLMLYVPVNNFQSCCDKSLSYWVEPVPS